MKTFTPAFLFILLCTSAQAQLKYHDASSLPVYGRATDATESRYTRLPDSLEHISRKPVWDLSRNSAGLAIRFSSNSSTIGAKWTNLFNNRMNHMTDTGIKGLDLYTLKDGSWTFVNCARPSFNKESQAVIIANMDPEEREYMLYLPLYDGIASLEIGTDSLAHVSPPKADTPQRSKPVVFYGTSILQGACASRPGMAFTNIISRRLDRETINLGFSGNALLDFEVAEVMAGVDAGCYVLDCVPNASAEMILTKMEKFYRIMRDKHPDTPVIFIEDPMFPHSRFDRRIANEINKKNKALGVIFNELVEKGEQNIYFISSENIIGDDNEATIDAIHFTDLGMMRYTELVCPVIEQVLAD